MLVIGMLLGAIRETSEALEDWEYATRMGYERDQVAAPRDRLKQYREQTIG